MYLSANKTIGGSSGELAFYAFLAGQGSGWIYTAALNTNAMNFTTDDRGKIVGLLACCFGLCSGIFSVVYKTFFVGHVAAFLGFLAFFLPLVAIILGCFFCNFLDAYPKEYAAERIRISIGYGILISIVILMCITSLVTNFTETGPLGFCITVLVLIASLSSIIFRTYTGFVLPPPPSLDVSLNSELTSSTNTSEIVSNVAELPLWRVWLTVDFWLLFFCHLAVAGAGVTILNNITELVYSLEDLPQADTVQQATMPYAKYPTTFVILFSVFNTSGRLVVGMLTDRYLHKLSRTSWLVIVAAVMALAQVYFLLTNIPGIFGGIIFIGIAYGGTFALVPTLTSELFGLKHFGANFGFVGLAPAVGSECISVLLAGKLNDTFKRDNYITIVAEGGISNTHCLGRVCYRYTLFVTLGLCCLAIVASFFLTLRQRKKYVKLDTDTSPAS